MYGITVFIAANIQPLVLLYKSEETWKSAQERMNSLDRMTVGGVARWNTIEDDYGQKLDMVSAPLAILAQDMTVAREADIERGIFNAVTQAKAQERAKGNPTLREAMRASQTGPAVMSPFPGMPMARN